MKIYISGKMTGMCEETSRILFLCASSIITSYGHEPINPWSINDRMPNASYEEKMEEDLRIISEEADAIYMLSNWKISDGAQREHEAAIFKGIPIYYDSDPSLFFFDMTFAKKRVKEQINK